MKDKELYDFLDELTAPDNKKIEEISRRYPVLDKSAKRRIAKLCEEKMSMKNNEYNTQETNDYETVNNVEEYKSHAGTAGLHLPLPLHWCLLLV